VTIYTAAITLFLVLDPLGNIPLFLSVLSDIDPARRRKISLGEREIALAILVAFLFFGKYILRGMNISQPALSIGGGIVLFLIALRMIFPGRSAAVVETNARDEEPLIVPLAVPLIAGPSAMATLILFSTQEPERITAWLIALLIAWAASATILFAADALRKTLGRRGLAALERLMGMILTTMAVQMLLTGIGMFLEHAT
jgi:multiple antibiotic resistance protein